MIIKRVVRILGITLFVAVVLIGQRWYSYVTNTKNPYDSVGIDINSRMPGPIRKWGCDQLKANFPGRLPPYGCQAADGTNGWI
ncbi:hypothetical protein WJT86_03905 [Microvirga sp. W0021]|uniref:Uncharacterized protein n=1 Tax=Hohaiivirga grylli TaxID=3133970 RepID=A0ABV0BGW0_9HYPH